ncbi:MAG: hypothetical protein NUK65_01845, partial [Firmicutes bacterium]|nr:hypothetical protein [Bacillota bacterium]
MIASMTGYGQAENDGGEAIRIKVEMRSVNHRYLDISIRTPREIQSLEDRVRRRIQQTLGRGRIDVFISWRDETDDATSVILDRALVRGYQQALQEIKDLCSLDQTPDLELIARFPDVLRVEKPQVDMDEVWARLQQVVDQTLENLVKQRHEEGARLYDDFMMRLASVSSTATEVEERAPVLVEENRKKLEDRMMEYLGQAEIDPARLLTEA